MSKGLEAVTAVLWGVHGEPFDAAALADQVVAAFLDEAGESIRWCEEHNSRMEVAPTLHSEDYDVCLYALSRRPHAPKDICRFVDAALVVGGLA